MTPDTTVDKIEWTRKLRRSGGSIVVTIPPELVDASAFEVGESVRLSTGLSDDPLTIIPSSDE